ncbi:hypothetical protein DW655_00090 [Lachnospiraceae bacterium AM23-2LB]|nr:hypothetical protein DW655_00090 [Lachnospiraceae bacterium AM23-2LB]RJW01050.1 hypothetical protein DW887_13795 [Lachnospiraceae bacterium AM40-2BH]DAW20334.1 MAG TPA: hypothetical protein [Caudoviricetes sp.]
MTVEEAFAMMEDAEKTKEDNTVFCEIDAETRKITVPETYKILGVESDEDSERVYFRAPRIVGDKIDLATLGLRINYQNANSQKDSYPVDDLTVENEFITFSWLLSRKAVAYKGAVKFIVCAVRIGDNAEISNEWNTTLASAEVLEGLEVDLSGIPDEEGKDLLEALIAQSQVKLMEVGEATEEAKRSAERADTAADSAGHAADAANNAAEEARRALEELKGNIGIDDNVVSENKTYSSKKIEEMVAVQLLTDAVLKNEIKTITADVQYQNGVLTITENEARFSGAFIQNIPVKKNTDYYISFKSKRTSNNGGGVVIYGSTPEDSDDKIIDDKRSILNYSGIFNTGEYEIIKVTFYCSTPATEAPNTCTFQNIILIEGENATPYVKNVKDVVKEVAKANKRIETLETDTDVSEKTVTFEMAAERAGVESGDSLAIAFGKLAKYCVDLKDHAFADPVNNLLGTDATLPLAATQGKALDEKITESNGNLVYTQQFIPEIAKNNIITDLLNININGVMNEPYMYPGSVATEDASTLKNSPIKTGAFYTYREVFFIPNQGIVGNTYGKTIIRLTEAYPVSGRIWTNVYNTDLNDWTGWKSITPV